VPDPLLLPTCACRPNTAELLHTCPNQHASTHLPHQCKMKRHPLWRHTLGSLPCTGRHTPAHEAMDEVLVTCSQLHLRTPSCTISGAGACKGRQLRPCKSDCLPLYKPSWWCESSVGCAYDITQFVGKQLPPAAAKLVPAIAERGVPSRVGTTCQSVFVKGETCRNAHLQQQIFCSARVACQAHGARDRHADCSCKWRCRCRTVRHAMAVDRLLPWQ
jgi:hypothetical protein